MKNKVAVVLYGLCRTYKTTASSLIENVLSPNNADLFIFTYNKTGESVIYNNMNINKSKNLYASQQDLQGDVVSKDSLKEVYGDYLKDFSINLFNPEKFKEDSKDVYSPVLKIDRVYSLYWNITNAILLLLKYAKEKNISYDSVILARPDLFFFEKIDLKNMDMSKINVPLYGGNLDNILSKPESYYVSCYQNINLGEYIPYRSVIFSDQLIISSFDNMKNLSLLYDSLKSYNSNLLPVCHPETVLYYHLVYKQKKKLCNCEILYKILRSNYVNATNEVIEYFANNRNILICKSLKYKEKLKNDFYIIKSAIVHIFKLPLHTVKYIKYVITKK